MDKCYRPYDGARDEGEGKGEGDSEGEGEGEDENDGEGESEGEGARSFAQAGNVRASAVTPVRRHSIEICERFASSSSSSSATTAIVVQNLVGI
ncbi:hypothetical protein M0802_002061 [Mischocyttarus mexicanus]|nr:hypothetical protein M0802_002061 [Mischocyttarus mexicanus]